MPIAKYNNVFSYKKINSKFKYQEVQLLHHDFVIVYITFPENQVVSFLSKIVI